MERLTMIDGIGNDELVRCMGCGLEKAGENLENCGFCEEGWQKALKKLAAYENTGLEPEDISSSANMKAIDKQAMLDLIVEARRADPEAGSFAEWLAEYLAKHLPTFAPPNEWVSREERLPEWMEDVIVHYSSGRIGISWIDSVGNFQFDDLYGRVTHWMPFPAPPERRPPEEKS